MFRKSTNFVSSFYMFLYYISHARHDYILAGAGVSLAKLSAEAKNHELAGLEFASGIPGTLGGALLMNAGAYGGEMKDVVEEVSFIDEDGTVKTIKNKDCNFSYRKSTFSDSNKIIISAKNATLGRAV